MAKKCIYCGTDIPDDSVVDICDKCGVGVWGKKMFKAIIDNMNNAREKGDLYQSSLNELDENPGNI